MENTITKIKEKIFQPFKTIQVANEFLNLGFKGKININQMKLNCLIYYSHGQNLAITGNPLIDEAILAGEYDPIIVSLNNIQLKQYGNRPIEKYWKEREENSNLLYKIFEKELGKAPFIKPTSPYSGVSKKLINEIWKIYKDFTGIQLYNMTYDEEGPWYQTYKKNNPFKIKNKEIPNELIKKYFVKLGTREE